MPERTSVQTGANAALPVRATFLSAEWRHLAILNYRVDPAVLADRLPPGLELDDWRGEHLVSVVGFLFLKTRLLGLPVPLHRDFEEVNLRFYVRRRTADGFRRGVVFVREIVPRPAIAWTARLIYNEPYIYAPMRHALEKRLCGFQAAYEWRLGGRWHRLSAATGARTAAALTPGGLEEFILEHYWGYNRSRSGKLIEYEVVHPPWKTWPVAEASLDCDVAALYGAEFVPYLQGQPHSAILAEGSEVAVRMKI